MTETRRKNDGKADATEAVLKAKTIFLNNISHDIRTTMTAITGFMDMAIKYIDNKDKVLDCLHKAKIIEEQLLHLINDAVDFARIGNGMIKANHALFNVRILCEHCDSIINGQNLSRKLTYASDASDIAHPYVLGDEPRIRQMLSNILINTMKFTKDGGHIALTVRETRSDGKTGTFEFTITNTSVSMTPGLISHIWDGISQESYIDRAEFQGTGLGMAITKELVTILGGTVDVKSEPDKGSTFTVVLPLELDPHGAKNAETDKDADQDIAGFRILLVEDNPHNQDITGDMLADEGALVELASNGREAIEIFEKSKPGAFNAILMDIMMPEMNGYEAAKAIRKMKRPDAKTVRIIAMSANTFAEDIALAKKADMNGHITTPIEMPILKYALRQKD